MNANQIIFALKEAHRLIDSVEFVGSPGDSEIVKSDLERAIQSMKDAQKMVMDLMVEYTA